MSRRLGIILATTVVALLVMTDGAWACRCMNRLVNRCGHRRACCCIHVQPSCCQPVCCLPSCCQPVVAPACCQPAGSAVISAPAEAKTVVPSPSTPGGPSLGADSKAPAETKKPIKPDANPVTTPAAPLPATNPPPPNVGPIEKEGAEHRVTPKPEIKPDVMPAVKPDVPPAVKPDVPPAVKPDVPPAVKPDVPPAVKPDVTPDLKPAVKPDDLKPAVKPDDLKPAVKPDDVKPAVKPDLMPNVKPDEPKPEAPKPPKAPKAKPDDPFESSNGVNALRMWTDASGKYRLEARFVSFENGAVRLQRANGRFVRIAYDALCAVDRDFVLNQDQCLLAVQ